MAAQNGPIAIHDLTWQEVGQFPSISDIPQGGLFSLSLSNNTTGLTHGLHRFPAKFIPQIPRWAIEQFGHGVRVLDPFMGSGTTLVEGLASGATCIGLDIDPLARMIADAKLGRVSVAELTDAIADIRPRWKAPALHLSAPLPDVHNFGHWFRAETWGWLQSLHAALLQLDCSEDARRFLLVVFSSTLRWVSNADDQSQKTYVSGTLKKSPPDVRTAFWKALDRGLAGLRSLERARSANAGEAAILVEGDACSIPLPDSSVGLIVTSPPYLDSVDYMYNMMLEYFWLGPHLGIPSRAAFNRRRRESIGAKNPGIAATIPASLAGIVDEAHVSPARLRAASAYFAAMAQHFSEAARCLSQGGRYVLVVGNSATKKGVVPVHAALAHLAQEAGLAVEHVFGYRIRRHYMKFPRNGRGGIILLDWVIVLRKGGRQTIDLGDLNTPWLALKPDAVAH